MSAATVHAPNVAKDEKEKYAQAAIEFGTCIECNCILWPKVHIYVMTNRKTEKELVVCHDCRWDIEWSDGWSDDEPENREDEK